MGRGDATTGRGEAAGAVWRSAWVAWAVPLALVLALSALLIPLRPVFGGANLSLVYVPLLLGVGIAFGTGPAVASAVAAFLASDYLFYEPRYTLVVHKGEHVLGLVIFLVVGVISGVLASRLRRQTEDAQRETRRAAMLFALNRALMADLTLAQVLTSIVRGVVEIYGARASRLLVRQGEDDFTVAAAWPAGDHPAPDRQLLHLARHAAETGTVTGIGGGGRRVLLPHGIATRPRELRGIGGDRVYVPVGTSEERFGVLEVAGRPGGGPFREDDARVLTSFADQAALAVQRARLIEQVTRTQALEQSSELKSALLAAVSHDLRTPLAAIKMSASALQDPSIEWADASRRELLSAIEESTDWLAQVVDNLLDLSRIEGGALRPDRDWHDLEDLLQHVLEHMERQTQRHRVSLEIAENLPLVFLDYVQISQVMANLIGNAVKYSEPGSAIEIAAAPVPGRREVEIRVTDHGRGIPKAGLPHIFETFYRARPDRQVAGTGVGLAICKGLVEAHGGTITAESRARQGTTIRVTLPVEPDDAETGMT